MVELYSYSAYLTFPDLNPRTVTSIREAAMVLPSSRFNPTCLEFDYEGRDANRKVVRFLARIAPLIGNAEGEVVCRYCDDEREDPGDEDFEFYSIRGGRLFRQRGRIVREPEEEVTGI